MRIIIPLILLLTISVAQTPMILDHYTGPEVSYLTLLPDSRTIFLASEDNSVTILDWSAGVLLNELPDIPLSAATTTLSPDGHYLVSHDTSGIIVYSLTDTLEAGRQLISVTEDSDWLITGLAVSPSSDVIAVAVSESGLERELVSIHRLSPPQRLFDVVNGPYESLLGYYDLAFDVSGSYLFATDESYILMWDLLGEDEPLLLTHDSAIYSLAANPGGKDDAPLLATGDEAGMITLWLLDGERTIQAHNAPITRLTFSPDGRYLASAGDDQQLILWDPLSGEAQFRFSHNRPISVLSFSRDGRYLAVNAGPEGTDSVFTIYGDYAAFPLFGMATVTPTAYTADQLSTSTRYAPYQASAPPSAPSPQQPGFSKPQSSNPVASLSLPNLTTTKANLTNSGRLEAGDQLLDDGSYFDIYTIDLQAGQEVTITLLSADFSTYVGLVSNDMTYTFETDEFPDDINRSRISATIAEAGSYYIVVTSTQSQETGNYLLSIRQ